MNKYYQILFYKSIPPPPLQIPDAPTAKTLNQLCFWPTGFTVVQKYVDVETAKQTGRSGFAEMVNYFKKQHKPKTQ